jgi:hypothetical protein
VLNRDVAALRPWGDLQRRATLNIVAPVDHTSISLANGATQATSVDQPDFNDGGVTTNWKVKISGYDSILTVSSVTESDPPGAVDSLELTNFLETWPHATVTDGTAKAWKDEYTLASDFSRPVNYVDFINHWKLQPIGMRHMRELAPWPAIPGKPRYYTLVKPAQGDVRVWHVLFYPPPDEAAIVPYEYISSNMAYTTAGVGQATLSADDDEPWMDERYRHILVYGALGEIYRDFKDDTRSAEARSMYEQLLRRMAADQETTDDMPQLKPSRARYRHLTRWRSTPQYDVNGNFDRMF